MRATLEFELPEDRVEHRRAVQAIDLYLVLCDFERYLHGQEESDTPADIHEIRQEFYAILENRDVRLD